MIGLHVAARRAQAEGNPAGAALARAVAAERRFLRSEGGSVDELEAVALSALPLVEEAGDHAGLARLWAMLAWRCGP